MQNNIIIQNHRRSPMCTGGGGVGAEGGLSVYVLCNMTCTHVYMSSLFQSRIGHKRIVDLDSR